MQSQYMSFSRLVGSFWRADTNTFTITNHRWTVKQKIIVFYCVYLWGFFQPCFLLIFDLRNTKPFVFFFIFWRPLTSSFFNAIKNRCVLSTEEEIKSCRTGYSLIMLLLGSSSKAKTFWIFQTSKGKQKYIKKKNGEAASYFTNKCKKNLRRGVCPYMHEHDIHFLLYSPCLSGDFSLGVVMS